ncbi:MAG: IPT/TIG domain-containing protein [Janthinobacterium lividum]
MFIPYFALPARPHTSPARRPGGWLVALLLLALLLAGRAAHAQAPATGAAPSVGAALNPDGTVCRDRPGSFDAKGYRMTLDPRTGAPVFRTTGAGDENWADNFGLNGANNTVRAVATAANGDVYVGGSFTAVGAVPANYVARWTGSAWQALGNGTTAATASNNGVNGPVYALAVVGSDLYVGGTFTTAYAVAGSQLLNYVARWDGTAWNGLGNGTTAATAGNNGVNNTVNALAVLGSDLYVGGTFTTAYAVAGSQLLNNVARYTGGAWQGLGNGTTAATAGNNGVNSTVQALAVLGSDLYVGGQFGTAYAVAGNQLLLRVARWTGSAWAGLGNGTTTATTTNNGVNTTVTALAVLGSDLYVGGLFGTAYTTAGSQRLAYVARWDGTAWNGLGNGTTAATVGNNGVNGYAYALAVVGSDLYVGGTFNTAYAVAGGQVLPSVARWTGSAWQGLGNGSTAATTTNNGVSSTVNALAVVGSDLYVGGSFTTAYTAAAGPQPASNVVRWTGTTFAGLNTGQNGANGTVYAVATATNGDVYVGGIFTAVGTVPANNVARWDGTAWNGLGNGTTAATATNNGVSGTVNALAGVGSDLYVGGTFTTAYAVAGNQPLLRVARWTGTAWNGLGNGTTAATASNNGVSGTVNALAVLGSDLYVGGTFATAYAVAGSQPLNYVARWTGSAWQGLGNGTTAATATNNGVNNTVNALAVLGSDLYVGGNFTTAYAVAGSQSLLRVARWTGSAWQGLGNGTTAATASNNGVNNVVYALAVVGSDLYVGGNFTTAYAVAGSQALNYVARWDGTAWNALGTGLNGTVRALALAGTRLVAGGSFTAVGDGSKVVSNVGFYTLPPASTLTAVSPAAELPGQVVTLTGTGFTAASTVSFGGTAAAVSYVSATTLTAVVPAGLAAGSAPVSVTTGSTTPAAQPFTALAVYSGGPVGTCLAAVPATATLNDGAWHYLLSTGGQVVAAYNYTDASLGTLALDVLRADPAQPVRQDGKGRTYLDRNWHLTASAGRFDGRTVALRLYGLNTEQARLQAADGTATMTNLKATQYSGANEDCDLANDDPAGEYRTLPAPASSPAGTVYFVAELSVADHFSEFYLTGSATPLPVQLVQFVATVASPTAVRLTWATASEQNSARFEVERSADGVTYTKVGTVAAAGTTATTHAYALLDAALPTGATVLYYRLRQVDLDGTFSYSPVRVVALGGAAAGLSLFPNPASSGATLTGATPGALVQVLDALGRCVATATIDATGTAVLALPAGLAPGVYVVRAGQQALRLAVE